MLTSVTFIVKIFFMIALVNPFLIAQSDFWEKTSGPSGGTIRAISIDSYGVIYAGGTSGYIFCSKNNGGSWINLGNGLPHYFPNSDIISIALNDSGYIFAGADGEGIFRSIDEGENWEKVYPYGQIYSLAFNSEGYVFAAAGVGVLRSTDNGENWELVGLVGGASTIVVGENDIIFAGSWDGGAFRSTDNGNNWFSIGLTSYPITSFAINSNGHIFAACHVTQYNDGGRIFRSTDSGTSWSRVFTYFIVYDLAINSSDNIFAGTDDGIFLSTDNGVNWAAINTGLTNNLIFTIAINSNDDVFIGTWRWGVFKSTNNGGSWDEINYGLINSGIQTITINSLGDIFAAFGERVFRSTDDGNTWSGIRVVSPGNYSTVGSIAINNLGDIFARTWYDGIYRSTDNGLSWNFIGDVNARSIVVNPVGYIFAGTYEGVFRSSDNGSSWHIINNGLNSTRIYSLALNPFGDIFAGTHKGIFRSTNNGENWTTAGLDTFSIISINISPSGNIYTSPVEYKAPGVVFGHGIFSSTDDGSTWTSLGLDTLLVKSLVTNSREAIFAGCWYREEPYDFGLGVFQSTDYGQTWKLLNGGLTDFGISALAIDQEGYIVAGTGQVLWSTWSIVAGGGSGVFRSVQSTTGINEVFEEIPTTFLLKQNYPNPFNPTTKIRWQSPVSRWQTLKVYDVLGNEVATLVDEYKPAGMYEVEFEASGLSSGVYFYRLQAGGFIQTKKMVLMK